MTLKPTNFSLKKVLALENDPFRKIQIKIFYFLMLFNFFKIVPFVWVMVSTQQYEALYSPIIAILVSAVFLKLLLSYPKYFSYLVHICLTMSFFGAAFELIVMGRELTMWRIMAIWMGTLWGFFSIGPKWGLVYALLHVCVIPIYAYVNSGPVELFPLIGTPYFYAHWTSIVVNIFLLLLAVCFYLQMLEQGEADKEKLNAALVKSSRSKANFLSTMTHELRTPLNTVIGISQLLIEKNKDADQKEDLDTLKFSAEGLLTLINSILDFNKFDEQSQKLEAIPFELDTIIYGLAEGMRIKAEEKSLLLQVEVDDRLRDFSLIGDPTRLSQVLFNLVGNAIKFTQVGSVCIAAKCVKNTANQVVVDFTISDTGIGIPAAAQAHIFEPFVQASTATAREFGGTGLGLSIVRHILALHQSEIKLSSIENLGTTFQFSIGYQTTTRTAAAEAVVAAATATPDFAGLNILLAEDNRMNIVFMKRLLSNWNVTPVIAENGLEAVKHAATQEFDLILMDLQMPEMGGLEAASIITKDRFLHHKPAIKIVALSASSEDEIRADLLASGIIGYMPKPFKLDTLRLYLKQVYAERLVQA